MNIKQVPLFFSVLLWSMAVAAQPAGYSVGKRILIHSDQVSGTAPLVDFPVLISLTDPDLRTVANGGKVTHANGYDIVFTAANGNTLLDHQIERYVPTTGEYIAWVRIPSLSPTEDTDLRMFYGNSTVATDPSQTSTWDANFIGVYHFNGTTQDATAQGTDLANINTTTLPSAKIGQGRDLNNSTDTPSSNAAGAHLQAPAGLFSGVTSFTFSGWVYMDRDNTQWERIFDFGQNTSVNFFLTPSHAGGSPAEARARITTAGNGAEQGVMVANPSAVTGQWIHWAVTLDSGTSTMRVFRNGVPYGSSGGVTLTPHNLGGTSANYFGRSQYSLDSYIDAKYDEFTLSRVSRSPDWIATAYVNQNAPASFYTVSAEMPAAALPVEWLSFTAKTTAAGTVQLDWQTAAEMDNAFFTVERSGDGLHWTTVTTLPGAGTSDHQATYSVSDSSPLPGRSFYRLTQTDFDGHATTSEVRTVTVTDSATPRITAYPNPFTDRVTVMAAAGWDQLALFSVTGRDVTAAVSIERQSDSTATLDLTDLPAGAYLLRTDTAARLLLKR